MYASNAIILAIAGLAAAQTTTIKPTPVPLPQPTGKGNGTVVTTTKVYDIYTTYCPYPTTVDFNGKKYVVDKPTTLTITDCPCTVVEEVPVGTRGAGDVWPGEKPNGGDKPNAGGDKPNAGGDKPSGDGSKPNAPEETVVITNGAGALELSFGIAAAFALLAL